MYAAPKYNVLICLIVHLHSECKSPDPCAGLTAKIGILIFGTREILNDTANPFRNSMQTPWNQSNI